MTHLDANWLIGLERGRPGILGACIRSESAGEALASSVIAWMEFLNGSPPAERVRFVERVLGGRILDFTREDAVEAARLFIASGRRRGSFNDCAIASCALRRGAALATENAPDFERFSDLRVVSARPKPPAP